jgi:hypothetical protein
MRDPMPRNEIIEMEEDQDEESQGQIEIAPKKAFTKKIDSEWMPQIMEWAATGLSYGKIAAKIKEVYGVTITGVGIGLAMKRVKQDRSNISKAIVRENIGIYIVNDLEVIKIKKDELVKLSDSFREAEDWKNYFQSIDKIKDYSKMIFELSGVNENQVINEAENSKQDLLKMLAVLK